MVTDDQLRVFITELMDAFYERRIGSLKKLDLRKILSKKNPYLYCALGIDDPRKIVEAIVNAQVSSSDEGLFGDAFFEPLALKLSGGHTAPSPGVDVVCEDSATYTAYAIKSGTAVFNAQSKKKQLEEFNSLAARVRKLGKRFDPVIGYGYGRKQQRSLASYREVAGQALWEELSGDPEAYVRIIQLLAEAPSSTVDDYERARTALIDELVAEFETDYCEADGTIDWEKIVRLNSSSVAPKRTRRR